MDDAVESLRSFRDRPQARRSTPLAERFSWGGRIVEQLLPILTDVYGPQGSDPSFRRIWNDLAMPRYRKRRLMRSDRFECRADGDSYLLAPRRGGNTALRCDAVGAAVWNLCDGSNRFVDIAWELHRSIPGSPSEMIGDLVELIDRFLDQGVVVIVEP